MFDTFQGLPIHPLVVHAAVVITPLAAIGLILVVLSTKLRRRYANLVLIAVLLAAGSTFAAAQSGKALAMRVGDPGRHAELGGLTTNWTLVLALAAVAWWLLQRRAGSEKPPLATTVLGWLLALGAIGAIALVGLTGHSGAERVWSQIVQATGG